VTMGATLGWPTVAVVGFLLVTGMVVMLATSSTARYEFERNGAGERQRSAAGGSPNHPAGSRPQRRSAGATEAQSRPQAVDVAVRPVSPPAADTGGSGWWLVDEDAQVLAGPFPDRVDCDWAAVSQNLPAATVHGVVDSDGALTPRPSPEERAFFSELGDQLERLPRDWDDVLTDTDPLTTLLVEIAAALFEAGLPLHDAAQLAGGVCLVPDFESGGVLVSWRAHDRMTVHDLRGAAAADTVAQSMNVAVADILWNLGFLVETVGATGSSLVTALR
jgi:hypothetical protein